MPLSFQDVKDRLFWSLLTGAAALTATWAAWISSEANQFTSFSDVRTMINTEAPYIQDRSKIAAALEHLARNEDKLGSIIEKNTSAINDLRVGIAELKARVTLKEESRGGK